MNRLKMQKIIFFFLFLTTSLFATAMLYAETDKSESDIKELKSEKPRKIKKQIKEIERSGKKSVPHLIRLLKEEDTFIRISAMSSLGRIKDERAVAPLINILQNDKNDDVRISATTVLGHLGDAEAVPALKEALTDNNKMIQIRAAGSLGMLNDSSGYATVYGYTGDADINIKANALQAFGLIGDERAISILGKYKDDREYRLSKAARISLRQIAIATEYRIALQKYKEAVAKAKRQALIEFSLTDTDPIIRNWALKTLILRINEKKIVNLFIIIANDIKHPLNDEVRAVLKSRNIDFSKKSK